MSRVIRINSTNLEENKAQYAALSVFSFNPKENKLLFENEVLPTSEIVIDEIFLMMDINDLRMFIKDGFYVKSEDNFAIEKLSNKLFLTEEDYGFLKNYAKTLSDRLYLYTKYKNILEKNMDSLSIRLFLQDTIIANNIMDRARKLVTPNENDVNSILVALYEKAKNEKVLIEQTNNANENKGMALKRTNNTSNFELGFDEEEYMRQSGRLDAAGFTSIIAVIAVAIAFGVYLAIISLG